MTDRALALVAQERDRQRRLIESGRIPWDCSARDVPDEAKVAVLGEEFGEVCRAVLEGHPPHVLRQELVQVAAVAVACVEALADE